MKYINKEIDFGHIIDTMQMSRIIVVKVLDELPRYQRRRIYKDPFNGQSIGYIEKATKNAIQIADHIEYNIENYKDSQL